MVRKVKGIAIIAKVMGMSVIHVSDYVVISNIMKIYRIRKGKSMLKF